MKNITITTLTETSAGTYNESGDILPDLLNGAPAPKTISEADDMLTDMGYVPAEGFEGWGSVYQHAEAGDILALNGPAEIYVQTTASLKGKAVAASRVEGDKLGAWVEDAVELHLTRHDGIQKLAFEMASADMESVEGDLAAASPEMNWDCSDILEAADNAGVSYPHESEGEWSGGNNQQDWLNELGRSYKRAWSKLLTDRK